MIFRYLPNSFLLLFLFVSLFTPQTRAQNYKVSGDTHYYIYEANNYKFIFPKEYQYLLPQLIHFNELLKTIYQKEFLWELDEPASLVLVSSQNQISNAFATTLPFVHTAFYSSGMEFTNHFGAANWSQTLLAHETAHLYQLNVKRKLPSLVKKVLGNNAFLSFFGIPFVPQPNVITPTYIMEGNAVMNESRFGIGGRLYVGPIRALVYSLIKDKNFNYTRILNNHIDFPFTREKYLVGGYLQAYYSRIFSESTANHFFSQQSHHWINPLILNSTHQNVFFNQQDTFDGQTLFDWFLMDHYSTALQQQTSPTESFVSSIVSADMNSDDQSVFFLVNEDGRAPYQLVEIPRTSPAKVKIREVNLPSGKLFRLKDGQFYSRSSLQYDYDNRRYSLYSEGHYVEDKFIDQFTFDLRAGHNLYAQSARSSAGNALYLDDQFLRLIHSNAILDQDGQHYYFLQEQKNRSLYKGKQKLATYRGYFSRLLEVHDGHIYFIANTEYGSSLFSFKEGRTYRWHTSDAIVDARHIHGQNFVIREVHSTGYQHKIISVSPQEQLPFEYTYHWESKPEFTLFQNNSTETKQDPKPFDEEKIKRYVPVRNFRYSFLAPQLIYSEYGGWGGYLTSLFIDPLFDNSLSFQYSNLEHDLNDFTAIYSNQTYRLRFYFGFSYDESGLIGTFTEDGELKEKLLATQHDNTYILGFTFPLFTYGLWNSTLGYEFNHETSSFLQSRSRKNTGLASWTLSWARQFPLSFKHYRAFNLNIAHMNTDNLTTQEHSDSFVAQTSMTYDFGYENILKLTAGGGVSPAGEISLNSFAPLRLTPFDFSRLSSNTTIKLDELQKFEVHFQKVFNQSVYSQHLPIGITRWAPTLVYNYYDFRRDISDSPREHFSEWGGGVEIEFLLLHLATVRSSLISVSDNQSDSSAQLRLSFNSRFEF